MNNKLLLASIFEKRGMQTRANILYRKIKIAAPTLTQQQNRDFFERKFPEENINKVFAIADQYQKRFKDTPEYHDNLEKIDNLDQVIELLQEEKVEKLSPKEEKILELKENFPDLVFEIEKINNSDIEPKYYDWIIDILKNQEQDSIEEIIVAVQMYQKNILEMDQKLEDFNFLSDLRNYLDSVLASNKDYYLSNIKHHALDSRYTDFIYESENFIVVLSGTTQSSQYWAAGTNWCTGYLEGNMFHDYSSQGYFLYYLITKKTSPIFDRSNSKNKISMGFLKGSDGKIVLSEDSNTTVDSENHKISVQEIKEYLGNESDLVLNNIYDDLKNKKETKYLKIIKNKSFAEFQEQFSSVTDFSEQQEFLYNHAEFVKSPEILYYILNLEGFETVKALAIEKNSNFPEEILKYIYEEFRKVHEEGFHGTGTGLLDFSLIHSVVKSKSISGDLLRKIVEEHVIDNYGLRLAFANKNMPQDLIKDHIDKLEYQTYIARNPSVSEEEIRKIINDGNQLAMENITKRNDLSVEIYKKLIDKFNYYVDRSVIMGSKKENSDVRNEIIKYLVDRGTSVQNYINMINWIPDISENILEEITKTLLELEKLSPNEYNLIRLILEANNANEKVINSIYKRIIDFKKHKINEGQFLGLIRRIVYQPRTPKEVLEDMLIRFDIRFSKKIGRLFLSEIFSIHNSIFKKRELRPEVLREYFRKNIEELGDKFKIQQARVLRNILNAENIPKDMVEKIIKLEVFRMSSAAQLILAENSHIDSAMLEEFSKIASPFVFMALIRNKNSSKKVLKTIFNRAEEHKKSDLIREKVKKIISQNKKKESKLNYLSNWLFKNNHISESLSIIKIIKKFSNYDDIDFDNKNLLERAKDFFGITYNYDEAGYILADGTMLDFSGKSEGGTPGIRSYDHRNIVMVMDTGEEAGSSSDIMDKFMKETGAIRVSKHNKFALLDMERWPTREQLKTIKEMIQFGKLNSIGIAPPGTSDVQYFEPVFWKEVASIIG